MKTILERILNHLKHHNEATILLYADNTKPSICSGYSLSIHADLDRESVKKLKHDLKNHDIMIDNFLHIVNNDSCRYSMKLIK